MAPFDRVISCTMLLGCDNVGGTLSPTAAVLTIVTVKLAVAVFPAASDAEHDTVVIPTENRYPDAGVHVGPIVTPTLSTAVGT